MKVYFDKIYFFRKQQKITYIELCNMIGIGRTTIWGWEKGINKPKEIYIRSIAKVLKISVDEISDLKPEKPISHMELSDAASSWFNVANLQKVNTVSEFDIILNNINAVKNKLDKASLIIKGLMKSTYAIISIKDTNLKYVIANKSFKENLKLKIDFTVLGKKDEDFYPLKESKLNESEDKKILLTGKSIINKSGFIPGSRKKKWGLTSKVPIYDNENKIQGILTSVIDITERKKVQNMREILELNINSMHEGLSLFDKSKNSYLYLNSSIEKIFGYSLKKFYTGKREFWLNTCVHPDDRENLKELSLYNKKSIALEYRIIKSNGDVRWLSTDHSVKQFLGKECILSIIKDITEEKQNKKILKLLEVNINNMSEGIAIMNEQSKNFIYINKAREKLYGYPNEIFFEKGIDFRLNTCIHPKDRGRLKKYYDTGNWPEYDEFRIIRPNGEIIWLSSTYTHTVFMGEKCTMSVQKNITKLKHQLKLTTNLKDDLEVSKKAGINEGLKIAALFLKDNGIDKEIIYKVLELN
ncbi:MAG: PAS domain-containing protein [bacterium]|nr:PAS domain-containing protein [bacterium]